MRIAILEANRQIGYTGSGCRRARDAPRDSSSSSSGVAVTSRRARIARVEAKRPRDPDVVVHVVEGAPEALDDLLAAVQALLDRVRLERGG